jgi:hypothetical protein
MRITTHTLFKGKSVSGKTNIISASLFRMKRSYMGFKKYHDHAINFIKLTHEMMPDWIVRMYVDSSLTKDEIEALTADHVEIVLYHCNDFWDSQSKTHEGVFGTFMRFLPMFSAQKYDTMISSDIDIFPFHLNVFKYLISNIDQIGLLSTSCHSQWIPPGAKYSILAGGIVSRVVFPRQLLLRYLEHIRDNKIVLRAIKPTDTDTTLPYGADEYFLNTSLSNYINSNGIHVLAFTLSTVVTAVRHLMKPIKNKELLTKLEKPLGILGYMDSKLWSNPQELNNTAFLPYLKKILPYVEETLEDSRYSECIRDYVQRPKIIKIKKFNYKE